MTLRQTTKQHSRKLTRTEKLSVRRLSREAWIDSDGDVDKAKRLVRARISEYGLSPAIIILAIRLAIILIQWWWDNRVESPSARLSAKEPLGATDDDVDTDGVMTVSDDDKEGVEDDSPAEIHPSATGSQFPGGRGSLSNTYDALPPSPRWKFNLRDVASVGAFTAAAQPVIVSASYAIEEAMTRFEPEVPAYMSPWLWGAWLAQTSGLAIVKAICNWMRPYGAGFLKDAMAYASIWIKAIFWDWVRSKFLWWWPFGRRRRRRRSDPDGEITPVPVPPRRRRRIRRRRTT